MLLHIIYTSKYSLLLISEKIPNAKRTIIRTGDEFTIRWAEAINTHNDIGSPSKSTKQKDIMAQYRSYFNSYGIRFHCLLLSYLHYCIVCLGGEEITGT